MNNKTIHRRISAGVAIFPVALLFFVLAIVSLNREGSIYLMCCMLLIGIILALTSMKVVLDRKPYVVLSNSGIYVRNLSSTEIPWSMIKTVEIQWIPRSGDFIKVTMANGDTAKFYADGLEVSSKELLGMIQTRIEQTQSGLELSM